MTRGIRGERWREAANTFIDHVGLRRPERPPERVTRRIERNPALHCARTHARIEFADADDWPPEVIDVFVEPSEDACVPHGEVDEQEKPRILLGRQSVSRGD